MQILRRLYQIRRNSGDQTSAETNLTSAFAVGTGTRVLNTQKLFTQGSLITTDNALDVAIEGSGFFQVLCLMTELVTQGMVLFLEMLKAFLQLKIRCPTRNSNTRGCPNKCIRKRCCP